MNYVYNYYEDTNTYEKYEAHLSSPNLYIEEKRNENVTGNVRVNYLNTFADVHTIDGFVGFEQNEYKESFLQGKRLNFPTGALEEISAGDPTTMETYGGSAKQARQNYFGRVLYDYDHTYMVQFQFRYDGSQNFPKGKRFGFFPGTSAGWTISKENLCRTSNGLTT
ncbi:MAG: TonB-dependent receptor [Tannerellaceae bacterium]|nr:TonB-dependent receptor [Tannerellaceae bacterium]MCD8263549.1 TonB-dependent receptor [Tannerellaceae bacterium]